LGVGAGVVDGAWVAGGVVGCAGCVVGGVDGAEVGGVSAGGVWVDWAMAIGVASRKAAAASTSVRFIGSPFKANPSDPRTNDTAAPSVSDRFPTIQQT
jgi:hypothetical protein